MLRLTPFIDTGKHLAVMLVTSFQLGLCSSLSADEESKQPVDEKNPEDPTKIVTRLGAGYNGELTINGSLGLGKARMISGFINSDASEWRLGGSWLFEKGIVNFNYASVCIINLAKQLCYLYRMFI